MSFLFLLFTIFFHMWQFLAVLICPERVKDIRIICLFLCLHNQKCEHMQEHLSQQVGA